MNKKLLLCGVLSILVVLLFSTICFAESVMIKIDDEDFFVEKGDQLNKAETAIYNYDDKTLTLNNYNGGPISYYDSEPLTIILKGDNVVTSSYFEMGISSDLSGLIFSGDGSLLIQDVRTGIYIDDGDLTIDGADIAIKNILQNGIMLNSGSVSIDGKLLMDDDLAKKEEETGMPSHYQGINIEGGDIKIKGEISFNNAGKALLTNSSVMIESGKIDFNILDYGINADKGFKMLDGSLDINVSEKNMSSFGIMSFGPINIEGGTLHVTVPEGTYNIVSIDEKNNEPVFKVADTLMIEPDINSIQIMSIDTGKSAKSIGQSGAQVVFDPVEGEIVKNIASEITIKPKKVYTYSILDGDKQEFIEGQIDNFSFTVDGDFKLFKNIQIDGLELENDVDYTVKEGSTIISFTDKGILKLNSLLADSYDIKINYSNDETVIAKLILKKDTSNSKQEDPKQEDPQKNEEIKEDEEVKQEIENNLVNPKTGDNIYYIGIIFVISLFGIILITKKLKSAK